VTEPSLAQKVLAIDQALHRAAIGHAFGGALALAYYAQPRATVDVDVNIFLPAERHEEVARALQPLGIDAALPRVRTDGQGRARWGRTPVDLFYAYTGLHRQMEQGVRQVPFGETTIPILAPEHLLVCKALFDRPKDWLDIEEVLRSNPELNANEVARWLESLLDTFDARVRRFQDLAAERPG
jgi:hypothetical protein